MLILVERSPRVRSGRDLGAAVSPVLRERWAEGLACLQFFSRLPLPQANRVPPFGRAIRLLPLAGMVIGACGALPLWAAAALGLPHPLAALAGTATLVLATGGLHEDGLADMADGFGGGATRERKLAIMRDSRIGTYGVLAVTLALAWRVVAADALLDRITPGATALTVLAAAALSRALALWPLARLPPARADGLGRGVGPLDRDALVVCFGLAGLLGVGLPVLAGFAWIRSLLACGLALLAAVGTTHLAARQIGGQTGDIAGACQQLGEAAFLAGLLVLPPVLS